MTTGADSEVGKWRYMMEQEQSTTPKKSMSVREMGRMLGLKKVESYWLVHKGYFETVLVGGKMRVLTDSFEEWYRGQFHYRKVDGEAPGSDYAHTLSVQEFADLIGVSGAAAYSLVDGQHSEIPMPAFESSEAMLQMEQEPEPEAEKEVDTDDKEVLLRLLAKPEMAELVKSLAANL